MPCYDANETILDLRKQNDTLAALLCDLCTRVCASGRRDMIDANRVLSEWWDRHQEADRRRKLALSAEAKARELRETALAKLSQEERKALGLKET